MGELAPSAPRACMAHFLLSYKNKVVKTLMLVLAIIDLFEI